MTKQHAYVHWLVFGALAVNTMLSLLQADYSQLGITASLAMVLAVRYRQSITDEAEPAPVTLLYGIMAFILLLIVVNLTRILR